MTRNFSRASARRSATFVVTIGAAVLVSGCGATSRSSASTATQAVASTTAAVPSASLATPSAVSAMSPPATSGATSPPVTTIAFSGRVTGNLRVTAVKCFASVPQSVGVSAEPPGIVADGTVGGRPWEFSVTLGTGADTPGGASLTIPPNQYAEYASAGNTGITNFVEKKSATVDVLMPADGYPEAPSGSVRATGSIVCP